MILYFRVIRSIQSRFIFRIPFRIKVTDSGGTGNTLMYFFMQTNYKVDTTFQIKIEN